VGHTLTEKKRTAFGPIRWAKQVPPLFLPDGKPDRSAHHVLLVMATFAKKDGTEVWPSMATLADESYMSLDAATEAVGRLQAAKLICQTGDMNGTPMWRLDMTVQRGRGETLREVRDERRRAADAARQKRYRQTLREKASHAVDSVTCHAVNGVTSEGSVTQSTPLRHGVDPRDVTDRTPSHPQVKQGVTAKRTELPTTELPDAAPSERAPATAPAPEAPLAPPKTAGDDTSKALFEAPTGRAKRAKPKKPTDPHEAQAQKIATGYYEAMSRMVAFVGVKQIVKQALKTFTVEQIGAGVDRLATVDRNRPFTRQTLLNAIEASIGTRPQGPTCTFESFLSSADAKAAADLLRAPYVDPSQHPNDPTPRAQWIRARRLEWIERHEDQIRAALTTKAS
jgi:hypothetical protein